MYKKYFAELVGTFTLSFVVFEAVAAGVAVPLPVPVIAALTLGLFVYTIGSILGCHLNPAVTVGFLRPAARRSKIPFGTWCFNLLEH